MDADPAVSADLVLVALDAPRSHPPPALPCHVTRAGPPPVGPVRSTPERTAFFPVPVLRTSKNVYVRIDLFMLHTNFQLLNRILTILLHLCCSSASPRVAHDSTFMRPALFCDFWAEKSCCSGLLLYKSNLFPSFYAFQSQSRRYNLSIKSVSARAD